MKTINDPHMGTSNQSRVFSDEDRAEFQAHWQVGDWYWLSNNCANLNNEDALDELTRIRLAIAHCQNGNALETLRLFKGIEPNPNNQQDIFFALMSGYAASLAKCYLCLGDEENAEKAILESVAFDGLQSPAETIAPLKLSLQAEQLGLYIHQHPSTQDRNLLDLVDLKNVLKFDDRFSHPKKRLLSLSFDVINQLVINGEGESNTLRNEDPFLSGKIMLSIANLLASFSEDRFCIKLLCAHFKKLITVYIDEPIDSWGIYFFLYALYKIKQLNLLEELFSQAELDKLQPKLHYKNFVNTENLELINKPTNFYQVAYSISLFRFHLGWEDGATKDAFLQKIIDHTEQSSMARGFADESNGKGLFDRYSILLIAEVAHKFRESGLPLTGQLKSWLKQAADFVLMHANSEGTGFQYGRSIGPYGDSSTNEILSAAAWFGLLNKKEKEIAYTYSRLSTERFLNFWWDHETNFVNLWTNGRSTDAYRDKHRTLGETLSLLHQHIYTTEIWEELGMEETVPSLPQQQDKAWLDSIPTAKYYSLDNKDSEYGIFIYRRKGNVFTLPFINGNKHHNKSFYLPIPYNVATIQGVPNVQFGILTPKITTQDGRKLMPLCWFKEIKLFEQNDLSVVGYKQYKFDLITGEKPVSDKNFRSETQYYFSKGKIIRQDKIMCLDGQPIDIEIEFLSFYPVDSINHGDVIFSEGLIERIVFEGFSEVRHEIINKSDQISSNEKAFSANIVAKTHSMGAECAPLQWTIFFRD